VLETLERRQLFAVTPPLQIIYQTDFESGDSGFTADNTGGAIPGLWHYSIGRYADGQSAHTPVHSWYYGQFESSVGAGTYIQPNHHLGVLSSPLIALPDCATLTGRFDYLLSTRPELSHDFVEVSVQYQDSSNQSHTVTLLSRAQGTLPETNHQWQTATLDLTQFAGLNIRLLFSFDTGDVVPIDPEGWYIDDVLVTSQENGSCPSADLSVSKSDGKVTAVPGELNSYVITVNNAGPDIVTSFLLTDTTVVLPELISPALFNPKFVPSNGIYDPVTHVWSGLNLASGQSVTMTFNGTINPLAWGNLVNTVSVNVPGGPKHVAPDDDDLLTPRADLTVTKDDGKSTALAGEVNTYTITVNNAGPSAVTSLLLVDQSTPAMLNPEFIPNVGTYDPVTHIWSGLNLAGGQSVSMALRGTLATSMIGTWVNTVNVAPQGVGMLDPRLENNSATDIDTSPQADLSVSKDDHKDKALPGEADSYTITVRNDGPATVNSVKLIDAISADFLNPAFAPSVGNYNPVTHTWSGLNLAPGQSAVITLTGTISVAARGNLLNKVSVAPPDGFVDPNPTNNSSTDATYIEPQADLSVTKTDRKDTASPGASTAYTIIVSNAGPSTVTSLELIDTTTPALLNPVFTPNVGFYDPVTHIWNGLNLTGGQTISMTLTGTINPTMAGILLNTVSVKPPVDVVDPNALNNSATDATDIEARADLSVTKTDGKDIALPGDTNTYTITVSNSGPSTVTSLELTDTTTPALLNQVFTPNGGLYDPLTHIWSGLNLASGQSISMVLTGTLAATTTGAWINRVKVFNRDGVFDANLGNNDAMDIDALPRVDLSVRKDDGKATVAPGESTLYTITVSNAGPDAVTCLELTDTSTPALLNPVFTPSIGIYDAVTRIWCGLNLASGQSESMTFRGQLNSTATGALSNTVTVAPVNGAIDTVPSNNSFTDVDTISTIPPKQADLRVAKDDGKTSVAPGDLVQYTITVSSLGPDAITSLTLIDSTSPALISPVFTPSVGRYDPVTHLWSGLNLASGQSITLTLSGWVNSTATGTLDNMVNVTTLDGVIDPNDGNNIAKDFDTINQTLQFISPLSFYRATGPLPTNGILPAPIPTPAPAPQAGKASIKGFKWNDLDQDGQWDSNELGRGGWEIYIDLNDDGVFNQQLEQSTITGADGSYLFANLSPGTYTIRENTTLLSDGTFTIQKFPSANKFTLTIQSKQVVEGHTGIAEAPNFGGFDYSPFIRPADDYLGHLRIASNADRQALLTALTPWQSFEISNTSTSSFQVTVDKSSIQTEVGRQLIRIVDANLNDVGTTFQVPAHSTRTLYVFFDPANDSVLTQYPSWYPGASNKSFTYSLGDHLNFKTDNDLTYQVDLVGASTYDSDIFYDGSVDGQDFGRLRRFFELSDKPITPDNPLFDPTSDINARCPNGAAGVSATCIWDLNGTLQREIWLGDFGPLNVEMNTLTKNTLAGVARAPYLDLDVNKPGTDKVLDLVGDSVRFLDSDFHFANNASRSVREVTVELLSPLDGHLSLPASSEFEISESGPSKLVIRPTTADTKSFEVALRNISFTATRFDLSRRVAISVTATGGDKFSEETGNVAKAKIRIDANVKSALTATAEGESQKLRLGTTIVESRSSISPSTPPTVEVGATHNRDSIIGNGTTTRAGVTSNTRGNVFNSRSMKSIQSSVASIAVNDSAQHGFPELHSNTTRVPIQIHRDTNVEVMTSLRHDEIFSSYAPEEFEADFAAMSLKRRNASSRVR
jgi:uncharacterized repeat protein (TIGR01451 family)